MPQKTIAGDVHAEKKAPNVSEEALGPVVDAGAVSEVPREETPQRELSKPAPFPMTVEAILFAAAWSAFVDHVEMSQVRRMLQQSIRDANAPAGEKKKVLREAVDKLVLVATAIQQESHQLISQL